MKYKLKINFHNSPRVLKTKTSKRTARTIPPSISIDEFDLIWGSIYANKENKYITNLKERLQYDISLVHYLFNLKSTHDLEINSDVLLLEQTQKASMMNRIGVILCNVAAKRCFGIKHLNHLITITGMNINNIGNKYPDFVARHNADYFVFEAKGTCLKSCPKQEMSAIDQLNSIATINGSVPEKYLIQSSIQTNKICLDIVDPVDGVEDLKINSESFNENKIDVKKGLIIKLSKLKSNAIGYIINNYFVGYIENECENDSMKNEDFIIENVSLHNTIYMGKVFADGTVILKETICDKHFLI